ncbi:phage tail tube protein [uncultured Enterococcus sp.]|uniref:phage tail tube protein n=1 Tax=uncultured Enterococcus sp. TaxID=167972 RepID=UPI002AA81489|nr:phage tail protein [uncultured Enterococcus sp.]
MARLKNALRGHFIAPWTKGETEAPTEGFLELAHFISDVSDDTDEETDDTGFYDGDGTKETTVIGVSGSYSFEGFYDQEDPAMAYIAGLKYKLGDERKVWHRVVSADGKKEWVGVAAVSGIVAGSGAATEYEAFSCTVSYNQIPEEKDLTTP